jgi:integrase
MDFNCVSSESDTPDEVSETANAALASLLPAKSKVQYEKAYNQFRMWCATKQVVKVTENVLLAYLEEKSKVLKPPTLWSTFSMLKSTLNVKENVDVRKFPKIVPYLKNKSVGYRGKKSKVLTREDITKFLEEADDGTYLLMKVVLIFGISGACRREELMKMSLDDIEDLDSVLVLKVPDSKTHSERTFTISNLEYIKMYRKYRALRPPHATSRRLFLRYASGKCSNQNVGINKIGEIPSLIAWYLGKPSAKQYTGHCFRRSSATLLANAGGDITSVKRHGGWKSTTVAEAYIEDSLANKIEISNKILNTQLSSAQEDMPNEVVHNSIDGIAQNMNGSGCKPAVSTSGISVGNNCTNFTINYYCNK